MGYKIMYAGGAAPQRKRTSPKLRLRILITLFLLVFAFTVRLTWPEGTKKLREVLIPGPLTVTEAAYSELLLDIRNGESVGQAVYTFCSTVLDEAH